MPINKTEFSWIDNPIDRLACEQMQAKMIELEPTKKEWLEDELWQAAVNALGGKGYDRIYICQECFCVYHGDYSDNSDPDRDFCGVQCEAEFLKKNPNAKYNGELNEDDDDGKRVGKKVAGRMLDGRVFNEYPTVERQNQQALQAFIQQGFDL